VEEAVAEEDLEEEEEEEIGDEVVGVGEDEVAVVE